MEVDLIWTLNQYRAAEIRGAGVILRLGRLASTSDLRSNFTRHLRDEGVHAWMWTRALLELGGEIEDLDDPYQARLGSSFGVPRTLNELLALTLTSKRRGVATYTEHLESGSVPPVVEKSLRAILKDERWHVDWIAAELDDRRRDDPTVDEILARAEAADAAAMAHLREIASVRPVDVDLVAAERELQQLNSTVRWTASAVRVAPHEPSATAGLFDEVHEGYRADVRRALERFDAAERDAWARAGHLPREAFATFCSSGLLRRRWQLGETAGLGFGLILAEESARASSGFGLGVMTHSEVFTNALVRLAETDRQRALLEDALDGRAVGCLSITEPHGGSDIASVRSTARIHDGGWILSGSKRFVSNVGTATHALVLARIEGRDAGSDTGLFVVPLDAPGVDRTRFHRKTGLASCDLGDLSIDVWLDEDALLGAPGGGILYANRLLQLERVAISCQLLAAARSALGFAVAYSHGRQLSTGSVISKQAVRHRLADCQTSLWAATAFFGSVVNRLRDGQNVAHETAGLKLHIASVASSIIDDSLQVLGGRGYTEQFPLEQWWRDVRVARIGGGPDEVLRDVVASKLDRPQPFYDAWVERIAADGA